MTIKSNFSLKRWLLFIAAAAFALCACFYFLAFSSPRAIKSNTEKKLHKLEKQAAVQLDSIYNHLHHASRRDFISYLSGNFTSSFRTKGIAYYVYENDSLQYWTDNHPAVENYMLNVCFEKQIVKLKNGYYEVIRHQKNAYNPYQLYALVLIKNNFAYQNRYLKNTFSEELKIPESAEIYEGKEKKKGHISIENQSGQYLFTLEIKDGTENKKLSIFSLISLCAGLAALLIYFRKKQAAFLIMHMVASVILYSFMFRSRLSFGQEAEGVISIFYLLTALQLTGIFLSVRISKNAVLMGCTFVFIIISNRFFLNAFGKSVAPGGFTELFFFPSVTVCINYISALLVCFCFSLIVHKFLANILHTKKENLYLFIFIAVTAAAAILEKIILHAGAACLLWPAALFALITVCHRLISINRYLYNILVCFFISLAVGYVTINLKHETDRQQRINLAEELRDPKDAVIENLFTPVTQSLASDKELKKILLKKDKSASAEQYLQRKYFMGYWERYHLSICLFDSLCVPLIPQSTQLYNNNTYFDDLISHKLQAVNENLYFNHVNKDTTFYLYKQDIPFSKKPYQLYVVVNSKKSNEYQGFPDLLLNQSQQALNADYSFAVYRNGILQDRQGDYNYTAQLDDKVKEISASNFYAENNYSHFVYRPDKTTTILITKYYKYTTDLSSTVSLLFLICTLCFLCYSIVIYLLYPGQNTLSLKIQHYLSVAVIIFFIPVTYNSFSLARRQVETENVENIKDRVQTISVYLGTQLAEYDSLQATNKDYVSYLLKQASTLFKGDLVLFSNKGEYYTAGLPKLFDEGIISKKINPPVFNNQLNQSIEKEVYRENIGSMNFYSAYRDIKNPAGKKLAIVNLPYFSRQNQLQAHLFNYLAAIFNIYVLSFMLVSIAAALLSNWLTNPLQKLQMQLKRVSLEKNNESITYAKNDEIGVLINEYNNMLVKLKKSADQLSKSEREGAWKEMARQVAHEIKNPLTPMKLSIQHVQRLLTMEPGKALEQTKKVMPVLLEQIETLAHIATEFSSFAKLPEARPEDIELVSFIKQTIALFASLENTEISLRADEEKAFVKGDKTQLLRVLNNLINNAIQAGDKNTTVITIELRKAGNKYIVSVRDNGSGISEEAREKIFRPNFSTKSYGTGLGLAMCKRIIEQHGGDIWFESEEGKGSLFYFSLPLV